MVYGPRDAQPFQDLWPLSGFDPGLCDPDAFMVEDRLGHYKINYLGCAFGPRRAARVPYITQQPRDGGQNEAEVEYDTRFSRPARSDMRDIICPALPSLASASSCSPGPVRHTKRKPSGPFNSKMEQHRVAPLGL